MNNMSAQDIDSMFKMFNLLHKLRVAYIGHHRISMALTLIGSSFPNNLVKPHWIPLPIVDTSAHFLEVVPYKEKCRG